MPGNLRELARFSDGLSCLYVEHAVLERQDKSIALYMAEGMVAVPAASLGLLLLGPGARITHAAVVCLAECGVTLLWMGEDSTRFYAWGTGKTRSASNLLKQAMAWAYQSQRLAVVKRLYSMRFPEPLPDSCTLAQIRGKEGVRVRQSYAAAGREYGIEWHGRSYKWGDWKISDPVNRALSCGAASLYGVCHAGIIAAGYSPAIGFIHVGKQLSFVYDVADLYKAEVLIPAAFKVAAECPGNPEAAVRKAIRERMWEVRLLERVIRDLSELFSGLGEDVSCDEFDESDAPGSLWDPLQDLPGGINHAGDDS